MTTKKTTPRKSQQRASDPTAIRATVYLPPKLHAALTRRMKLERKQARDAAHGERGTVKRVTLSDVLVRACAKYLGMQV